MTPTFVHMADLRTALQQAFEAAGRSAPAFTDPSTSTGTTRIRLVHIKELRDAVLVLEAS